METVGVKVIDFLKVDDPFRTNCSKKDSKACQNGDKRNESYSNCRKSNNGKKEEFTEYMKEICQEIARPMPMLKPSLNLA